MNSPTTAKKLKLSERVKIVVVEDHHHVLEHIHAALRRRKFLPSWRMLHVDAHPDCMCIYLCIYWFINSYSLWKIYLFMFLYRCMKVKWLVRSTLF